ncbi:hypothetical protein [Spirochaeta africana]|uniref:Lipoprotein n=1 Tax=Spirochaeta africana (strain ATCC 700263 / DSM 8902 / Z-7692) TaxID=889378 RepID=H9ULF8_SPIAZ|nr:hypothetical protein [Spirochaeta africana]AFG38351.1 hypothetical protein Spiaf_2319 [Spirochaeta africana DSM 8902]
MKNLLILSIAMMLVLALVGCAGEASAEAEYQSVIEAMTESFTALSDEIDAAESADAVAGVLNSYATEVPAINSRFVGLQEKYPDTDLEAFQESESFVNAISELENANMRVIQTIVGLEQRFGDDESVQEAAWGYIQSLSMTEEDLPGDS